MPLRKAALASVIALSTAMPVLAERGSAAPAQDALGHVELTPAEITPLRQALAEATLGSGDIAAFYKSRGFAPLWTGETAQDKARLAALLEALGQSALHGLPHETYQYEALIAALRQVRGPDERAVLELQLSETFLRYARDVQSGVLTPSDIDSGLVRKVAVTAPVTHLKALAAAPSAEDAIAGLAPQSFEYRRLLKAKRTMARVMAQGGWGAPVRAERLDPGDQGAAVIALRNRLQRMGYLARSASPNYDGALTDAVQAFQTDHGLASDGVAGPATLREINQSTEERVQAILVALERERWLSQPGVKNAASPADGRHILVNLTDFSARVMDDQVETFRTRAVIGKNTSDRRTPEFSDVMEFMVINPSRHVPRSITVKEYLPQLRQNPHALAHLDVVDRSGRVVSRSGASFADYSTQSFPYRLRQPPSTSNALGLVKFMFPNKYNIYLHDTPAKNLFSRQVRAYSHGCVRLHQPFEFAYTLLGAQEADPEGYFQRILNTGRERRVDLATPVPVHITYRTAFTDATGRVFFRPDIYGRDAAIWKALAREGVSLDAVRG